MTLTTELYCEVKNDDATIKTLGEKYNKTIFFLRKIKRNLFRKVRKDKRKKKTEFKDYEIITRK